MRVAIDLGSSATKIVYQHHGLADLWLPPEVIEINESQLEKIQAGFGEMTVKPQNALWVETDGKYYAVGTLAKTLGGVPSLEIPKVQKALYKILGVLGLLANEPSVSLACLLPLEEYWQDGEQLKASLQKSVATFTCSGKTHRLSLKPYLLLPEGYGLFMGLGQKRAKQSVDIRESTVAVVMMGHRNLTVLMFEPGARPTQQNSTSRGPGFYSAIKQIASGLPEVNPSDPKLLKAILYGDSQFFVKGRSTPYDLNKLKLEALAAYQIQVQEFLQEHLAPEPRMEVIIGGGASMWLEELLLKYFASCNVTWAKDLIEHDTQEKGRLADVFLAHQYLVAQSTKGA